MFKSLRLATKMLCSFGLVAAIGLFLGLFGYYGAAKNLEIIEDLGQVQLPNVEYLLTIEVQANALRAAYRSLLIPDLEEKEHKAQFSAITTANNKIETAWKAYEAIPQTSEEGEQWKQFISAWKRWQEDANTFLEMQRKLDAMDLGNPDELADHFAMFRGDHHKLVAEVLTLLHDEKTFEGGESHEGCNFGKWLTTFKTTNDQMNALLREVADPHAKFHAGVKQVKALMAAGKAEEAKAVYKTQIAANKEAIFQKFNAIRAITDNAGELNKAADKQHFGPMREHGDTAKELLDKIIKLDSEVAANNVKIGERQAQWLETTSLVASGAGVLLALGMALIITRAITRPINVAVGVAEELSRGNLTVSVKAEGRDEIGRLLGALGTMVDSLRSMFTEITEGVETLASSSNDLAAVSRQLSIASKETSDKSNSVATASEEMTTNFQSVSAAMEQSTANVNMIASSTEEMTATVNEIAESAEKARVIADTAVKQSQSTSVKMADLEDSAKKIGRVTETITEISEQTNLLALNATIEAARAGEAGKGFAVVANEIKELARQTAAATVDIKNQIGDMQQTTNATIEDMTRISEVIAEINTVINAIATAVEEQSAATGEISGNIAQASSGISEVNENVAQSSVVAADITRDVSGISTQARQVGEGSAQVQASAQNLSDLSDKLKLLVKKFNV